MVFWMCVALLQSAYATAVVYGLTSTMALWSRVAMVLLKKTLLFLTFVVIY